METDTRAVTSSAEKLCNEVDDSGLRRGPWTLEEDTLLTHYVAQNGEGRWNMVAKCAGLKRTGKSCRLRWLNYLKPDIKRGDLTPQEQLLILELHSKWGNKWSKIAQHLPGRTDNEIKNYWRTRVQKQARQLNIESNSQRFFDAVRGFWMPRLVEKMEQTSSSSSPASSSSSFSSNYSSSFTDLNNTAPSSVFPHYSQPDVSNICPSVESLSLSPDLLTMNFADGSYFPNYDNSRTNTVLSSDPMALPQLVEISQSPTSPSMYATSVYHHSFNNFGYDVAYMSAVDSSMFVPPEFHAAGSDGVMGDAPADLSWNMDDIWQFKA